MRPRTLLAGIALVVATCVVTSQVLSQDKEAPKPPGKQEPGQMDPAMAAWMKYAAPGKYHAYLEPLAGHWEQVVKWRMHPEAPWQEGKGHSDYEWILGGRFLMQRAHGDPMIGPPFEGLGILGYDNYRKKFTSVWVDNMSTMTYVSYGTADESGKVITLEGEYDDPATGKKKKARSVFRIESKDRHASEVYEDGPEGKPFKSLEIVYTRTAGTPKPPEE